MHDVMKSPFLFAAVLMLGACATGLPASSTPTMLHVRFYDDPSDASKAPPIFTADYAFKLNQYQTIELPDMPMVECNLGRDHCKHALLLSDVLLMAHPVDAQSVWLAGELGSAQGSLLVEENMAPRTLEEIRNLPMPADKRTGGGGGDRQSFMRAVKIGDTLELKSTMGTRLVIEVR